jgi:hypothetical protein
MSKVVTRTFTKEELVDSRGLPESNWVGPDDECEEIYVNEVVDTSRWSIRYKLVFQYGDKAYQTYYQVGATEMQDERPWEYEDEIECHEVEEVEVMVKQWVRVEEDPDQ